MLEDLGRWYKVLGIREPGKKKRSTAHNFEVLSKRVRQRYCASVLDLGRRHLKRRREISG
jgi:hypothetical protein